MEPQQFIMFFIASWLTTSVLLSSLTRADSGVRNSLFVISQAETPSLGINGLTPVGLQRAQTCIPNVMSSTIMMNMVFNASNIGLVLSCTPDPDSGACFAAVATVTPLARNLNLTVDISCSLVYLTVTGDSDTGDNAQDDCVSDLIASFAAKSNKAIIAVWDAGDEDTFFENLDIDLPDDIDDGVFHHDVITTIRADTFISRTSQNCPGLDGMAPGTGDVFVQKPQETENSDDSQDD
ncbi:hypothetical protein M422DRAFT_70933 [Sphaerobolus stellatus SS14]|uniref:Uncharacterized protein n=1 Tax=Sphaerobolus stellatus (strain SS14) TaxID=990650 RepID=A0A0C9UPC1_SPHS4|nr:hypothetical protein M422DRAFT_70933 [Sphaerobolus stellatus SS14]